MGCVFGCGGFWFYFFGQQGYFEGFFVCFYSDSMAFALKAKNMFMVLGSYLLPQDSQFSGSLPAAPLSLIALSWLIHLTQKVFL